MFYQRIHVKTIILLICLISFQALCKEGMGRNQVFDLARKIEDELGKNVSDRAPAENIIHGTGFSFLNTRSDMLAVKDILLVDLDNFLRDYLQTINLGSQQSNELLRKFCSVLKHTQITKWQKFETVYSNQGGQGSWIGIYFHRKTQNSAQFYSNHIKSAFSLVPDVLMIRKEESSRFLVWEFSHSGYEFVEKNRGLAKEDLQSIFTVCSGLTYTMAIAP